MNNFRNKIENWFESRYGQILLLPTLIFMLLIVVYPLFYSFGLSFFNWNLLNPGHGPNFIGFENYQKILSSESFWSSLKVTFNYAFGVVLIEFIFGLGIALLLTKGKKLTNLVRTIMIIPLASAPIATALSWRWMFDAGNGVINWFLRLLGHSRVLFLSSTSKALLSVMIVDIWNYTPFITLVLLAGLISISQEIYEAAKVDGANWWQNFRYITLPLLKPLIFLVLLIRTTDALRVFDSIYALTGGGPANVTKVMSIDIYNYSFKFFRMGMGSAYSWIMIIILLIFGIFIYKRT